MLQAENIQNFLTERQLYADVYTGETLVFVDIQHGDWKHDHFRCHHLMDKLGYELAETKVTFSDGSDCYSAAHMYCKKGE